MFSIFRDSDQLVSVEDRLEMMLGDCRRMFDLARDAIFGRQAADDVKEDLWALDKDVNRSERELRRELMVHGAVRGVETNQGLLLAFMSVAKDLERIGDYCKNIWDLADLGVTFDDDADFADLEAHAADVARLLASGAEAFTQRDAEAVHELIPKIEENEGHFDGHVDQYVLSDEPGNVAAPRALFFRYLKRISGHLSNVLSSVVMPVDRLDFYKRSKALDT